MQGDSVSTIGKDGTIIRSIIPPAGFHGEHQAEHFYSEIPPPPPMEPFPIGDIKGGSYNRAGPPLSTASSRPYGPYNGSGRGTLSTNLSKPSSGQSKMDDLDLNFYARMKEPWCTCTKQVTAHVIIMIVAGIVYLGIGGLAGFYLGKFYADENSRHEPLALSGVETTTLSSGHVTTTSDVGDNNATTPGGSNRWCSQEGLMCRCGPVGGDALEPFISHREQWMRNGNVSGFILAHNNYIIQWIQFLYGTAPESKNTKFGLSDGNLEVRVDLQRDEYITELVLDFTEAKPFLTRVFTHTNLGRTFGPLGGVGSRRYRLRGNKLMYVEGHSGNLVNQLTGYFDKCT